MRDSPPADPAQASRNTPRARAWVACAALTATGFMALTACNTRNPYGDWLWYDQPVPSSNFTPAVQQSPYMLAMFEGTTGKPLSWTDLWNGMHWADIVVVGEQHDDPTAHAVQLTLMEEMLAAWPGSALSMEQLERNEQALVDQYVAGTLTKEQFVADTKSENWAGKGTWDEYYQPMIDAVRNAGHGARVVAANAPRQYVRLARTDGYDALLALPPEEQAQFDLPAAAAPAKYRERFREFMTDDGKVPTDEELDRGIKPQRVWDATMAASIARAYHELPKGAKLLHTVGQFHSEYDGGLISEIQARASGARILTVTVQTGEAQALRAEDLGKADVVVYGVAPPPTWTAVKSRIKKQEDAVAPLDADALPEWGVSH